MKKIVDIGLVLMVVMAGLAGIFLVFPGDKTAVSATTWYVNDDGTPGVDCNYTSIQAAIDAPATLDGDTIFVYNGTYYENVIVNKSINLTGENSGTTIINGSWSGDVVTIISDWANITGFNVTGSGSTSGDSGIELNNVQHCGVFNNNVSLNINSGLYLFSSSNNTIMDNNISNNKKTGIGLSSSSNNNLISQNNIILNDLNGIDIDHESNNNTIKSNDISYNNRNGVQTRSSSIFMDNEIQSNFWNGIHLEGSSNNIVINNTVHSNGFNGIYCDWSANNTITDNNVSSLDWNGIYIWSSSDNILLNNTFQNSGVYIRGSKLSHFNTHTIPTNNLVNGNPLYYYKDTNGIDIDGISVGQVILANCSDFNVSNLHINNTDVGIEIAYSTDIGIYNNNISFNNFEGVLLDSSSNNSIINNDVYSCNGTGISLQGSMNNTITSNNVSNNIEGIYLYKSSNNNIQDNMVFSNKFNGIKSYWSLANNITSNEVYYNQAGFYLQWSPINNITSNIVYSNNGTGIYLWSLSDSNMIANNIIYYNNGNGIELEGTSNHVITNNEIYSNSNYGIVFQDSSNNMVTDNIISENKIGFYIYSTLNNNITNNTFHNNGVFFDEGTLSEFNTHTIPTNNMVNGKPLYYYKNSSGININGIQLGQLIIANCTDINIKDLQINNTDVGIQIAYSSNVYATGNNISLNNQCGIYNIRSSNISIAYNEVSSNKYGIQLYWLSNNNITNNNVSNNENGILLYGSSDNRIYHNNIVDNNVQAFDLGGINLWNDSYPSGGNYWLDFDEPGEGAYDDYMGIDQDVLGSDGIIDNGSGAGGGKNPYIIDLDSMDFYPLKEPYNASPPIDTIPPASIADLEAINPTDIAITLTWTAPGDDGDIGFAEGYIVKYTTTGPITEANWSSALSYSQSWIPLSAGFKETRVVSGLSSATQYWFAIKAYDDALNQNIISNSPNETTLPQTIIVPGVVRSLMVDEGDSYLNLTWETPVSDGGSLIILYNIYRNGTIGVYDTVTSDQLWFNDTDVTYWITYTYNISAVNGIGEGPNSSASGMPMTLPSMPINLQADSGNGYVNLSWEVPSVGTISILEYNIYRTDTQGVYTSVPAGQLWFNDTNVTNGITYEYNVSALNGIGEGPRSLNINETPMTIPSAPLDPQAVAGNSFVNLSWDPPASDGGSSITGYNIYRDGILIGSVSSSQLWYNDTGLVNGVTYSYNISAMNAVGEGPRFSISATPRAIPSAPSNLQATAGDSFVNLVWEAPASNGGSQVINYAIYRGTSSGEETFLTEIGTVLNYNDTTVTNDVTYYYKVRAKNIVGEGPLSAVASATPKGPEVNVPDDEDQPVWLLWLLIIIIIIVLVILFILFKRRKGGEGLPPQESQEESLGNESEMPREKEN